ncbi:hypothetical protein HB662_01445 [Roseomonas frigidaquae]|uniref:Uncharacterized protein n=1 Tax=Falsiroseomonas frigidaquae TaxID=487318 RepID=A0ABX1ES98_9PROT|nr:hypothetical protein [Falsiroseomonas frigidaquae]NKE43423.1 hypothetical protein [Falsiroseomonas frigidaquae]
MLQRTTPRVPPLADGRAALAALSFKKDRVEIERVAAVALRSAVQPEGKRCQRRPADRNPQKTAILGGRLRAAAGGNSARGGAFDSFALSRV